MAKSKIVFDIETVGADFDGLAKDVQEQLLKYARTPEEEQVVRDSLGFYPVTAQIVTIAMLEVDTDRALVFFQDPSQPPVKTTEGASTFISLPGEKQLLEGFWKAIASCDQFVTFNGRAFDCPFIMVRSATHRLRAAKNLMPDRYRSNTHIDLMEKLTFLGATRRRFSLHMWCHAFGIKSPKAEGVDGSQVKNLFGQGRHMDIARYCLRDVLATKELYRAWDTYINFS